MPTLPGRPPPRTRLPWVAPGHASEALFPMEDGLLQGQFWRGTPGPSTTGREVDGLHMHLPRGRSAAASQRALRRPALAAEQAAGAPGCRPLAARRLAVCAGGRARGAVPGLQTTAGMAGQAACSQFTQMCLSANHKKSVHSPPPPAMRPTPQGRQLRPGTRPHKTATRGGRWHVPAAVCVWGGGGSWGGRSGSAGVTGRALQTHTALLCSARATRHTGQPTPGRDSKPSTHAPPPAFPHPTPHPAAPPLPQHPTCTGVHVSAACSGAMPRLPMPTITSAWLHSSREASPTWLLKREAKLQGRGGRETRGLLCLLALFCGESAGMHVQRARGCVHTHPAAQTHSAPSLLACATPPDKGDGCACCHGPCFLLPPLLQLDIRRNQEGAVDIIDWEGPDATLIDCLNMALWNSPLAHHVADFDERPRAQLCQRALVLVPIAAHQQLRRENIKKVGPGCGVYTWGGRSGAGRCPACAPAPCSWGCAPWASANRGQGKKCTHPPRAPPTLPPSLAAAA